MGILDLFRRFFSKKEEEVKEIELEQLGSWIDARSKKALEKTNTELIYLRQRLAEEKRKLTDDIQTLKQAQLKNPKIPERVKHILEGSRTAYIQKVTMFFEELTLPEEFDQLLEFCDAFDKNLEQLGKKTVKNHQVLREFFADKAGDVSADIKHIHDVMEKVKKLIQDTGIQKVEDVKNQVTHVQRKIEQKQEMKEQLKRAEQELQKESKDREDKEKKIKKFEEGNAYKNFVNLLNEKQAIQKEIQGVEKHDSFSIIEAALKKYERLTLDDTLVRKYLDNPVKALLQDKELKIVALLAKMKESILSGGLELKAKKKEKILRELDKLNRGHFEAYVTRHNELHEKLKAIETEIRTVGIVKEIEELKQGLVQNKGKAEKVQTEINELMKEVERIDIGYLKENLEKEIRAHIDETVRIP